MTNADKYLKEGITPAIFCKACTTGTINVCALAEWLRKEAKPTLTEDEKVILRNALESGADAIFRNDGGIYFHTKPGTKGIFGNIFQFIQQRRRI